MDTFTYPGVTLRPAADADVPALAALINRSFAYADGVKGSPRTDESALRRKLASDLFYVCEDETGIVACFYLKPLRITLYFGMLSVDERYRGRGLASAIIAAIEARARVTGKTQLRLDYMALAPWLGTYYERYGFTRTGVVRSIGWTDLVRMQKPLR